MDVSNLVEIERFGWNAETFFFLTALLVSGITWFFNIIELHNAKKTNCAAVSETVALNGLVVNTFIFLYGSLIGSVLLMFHGLTRLPVSYCFCTLIGINDYRKIKVYRNHDVELREALRDFVRCLFKICLIVVYLVAVIYPLVKAVQSEDVIGSYKHHTTQVYFLISFATVILSTFEIFSLRRSFRNGTGKGFMDLRKRTLAVIIPGALCVYSLAFGLNEQAIIGGLTCLVAGIILTMLIKNRA